MTRTTTVKVLRIDDDGTEHFERYSMLRDCFPDDDQNNYDFEAAAYELCHMGRAWVGGGASPLFLLIAADD